MTTAAAWTALTLSTITITYLAAAWLIVNRSSRKVSEERADLLHFLTPPSGGPDYTGMPGTEQCLCGCTMFHAAVAFDEGEIAYYILEGICMACGAKVALPYINEHEEAE